MTTTRRLLTASLATTLTAGLLAVPTAAFAVPVEGAGTQGPTSGPTARDSWAGNLLQEVANDPVGHDYGNLLEEAAGNLLGEEYGNLLGPTGGNLLDEGEEVTGEAGELARETAMEGLALVRETVWG